MISQLVCELFTSCITIDEYDKCLDNIALYVIGKPYYCSLCNSLMLYKC